jgi:phage shock protein C
MRGEPLTRSTDNRIVAGVLGGIAEYFDLDARLVRIAYVILSVVSVVFPGTLVYLLLWLVIPSEDRYSRW